MRKWGRLLTNEKEAIFSPIPKWKFGSSVMKLVSSHLLKSMYLFQGVLAEIGNRHCMKFRCCQK